MCENAGIGYLKYANSSRSAQVKDVFTVLADGEKEICMLGQQSNLNEAILVFRNAKSYTRAFSRWMAGQDSKLESKRDETHLGEFVIVDSDEKLKQTSTYVPVLIPDPQSASFYDLPALAVHRNVAYDVAASHFTNRVISNLPRMKICFLIEYRIVTASGKRNALYSFMKHFTNLFTPAAVQENVLLVVSEIPSALSIKPDDEIFAVVVRGMTLLKKELLQESQRNEEKTQIIELLDLLVVKEGGYPKLALFRSPNEEGPLSNITLLNENKKKVKAKLQNIDFVELDRRDLKCIRSETSIVQIWAMMRELRDGIVREVKVNGNLVQRYFEEIFLPTVDFERNRYATFWQIRSKYQDMLAIKTNRARGSLQHCLTQIFNGVNRITDKSVNVDQSFITDSWYVLEFLSRIIDCAYLDRNLEWCTDGLTDITKYLDDLQNWYRVTFSAHNDIPDCRLSREKNSLVIPRDSNYLYSYPDLFKKISDTNIKEFLRRSPQNEVYFRYEDVKDIIITYSKFKELDKLEHSLRLRLIEICGDGTPSDRKHLSIRDIYYTTREYIDDLYRLEEQLNQQSNRTSYLPYYESMHDRIQGYMNKRMANNTLNIDSGDYKALNYLQITTFGRVRNLQEGFDDYVVVDLNGYFQLIEAHINDYSKSLSAMQLEQNQDKYKDSITAKILEAYEVVESLLPLIEETFVKIRQEIDRLIEVVINLEKEGERQKEELKRERDSLASLLPVKALMTGLKLGCLAASFGGGIGIIASAGGGLLINYAESKIAAQEGVVENMIQRQEAFSNALRDVYPMEQQNVKAHLKYLFDIFNTTEAKQLANYSAYFKTVQTALQEMGELADNKTVNQTTFIQRSRNQRNTVYHYCGLMIANYETTENSCNVTVETKDKESKLKTYSERISKALTIIESGIEEFQKSQAIVERAGDAIDKYDQTIKRLKEYENSIRTQLAPEVDNIQNDMKDVLRNSANKSHAVLAKNKLLMQNLLTDFENNVNFMDQISTPGAPIMKNVKTCINKLRNAMTISLQIYERVQDYQGQAKLATFIYDMHNSDNFDRINDDPDLRHHTEQLQLQVLANIIWEEYKKALSTWKQLMFPFVERFLNRFDTTTYLKPYNTTYLVTKSKAQINLLRQDLILLSTTTARLPDHPAYEVRFDTSNVDQKPFFIWSHENHHTRISRLLRGEQVSFVADITQVSRDFNTNWNAVKYNELGIRFLSQDKTVEKDLYNLMEKFRIELIHVGDSHYRCDNEYYIFNHNPVIQTEAVNYRLDFNNKPTYDYKEITNIQDNKPIFSPYAGWKFTLKLKDPFQRGHRKIMRKLRAFENKPIDIALEGKGSHVTAFPASSCKKDLQKYYRLGGKVPPLAEDLESEETNTEDSNSQEKNAKLKRALYATNSANNIKSSLSNAVCWLTATLGYFIPVWKPTRPYDPIKQSFATVFAQSKLSNAHQPEDYFEADATSAKFDIFESLTLADFFIRWLTKVKPYDNRVAGLENLIEIRTVALTLVERVENMVQLDLTDESAGSIDSLALLSRLEKEMMTNRNVSAISSVLYQTIVEANSNLDRSPFNDIIRKKITEIVLE